MSPKPILIIVVLVLAGAAVLLAGQVVIDVKTIREEARSAASSRKSSWLSFDRNKDGRDDQFVKVDDKGQKIYEELDFNFDGEFDDFCFYTDGVMVREEINTNFDGKIDLWVHMFRGIYVESYERDTDFDGKPDLVKRFGKK